jgi:putative methyltransferase (TIGR04325 family)
VEVERMTNAGLLTFPRGGRRWIRPLLENAARLPGVRPVVSAGYERYFDRAGGNVRLFRGIYPDVATAARALPAGRSVGYDNAASAYRVIDEWNVIYEHDYPVMFWLDRMLPECELLFDWGGNVGLKYFSYRSYLTYPETMRWRVCDVPAVVAAGEDIARREGVTDLDFTTTLDDLSRADVLFAAGALHFVEDPFAMLRAQPSLPEHFLFSKVPIYDRPAAVTLQNMGSSVCLYHLFNRAEFIANVTSLGYELIDEWKSSDCFCHIPFHPEHSIDAYSGFYFRKAKR